MQNVARQLRRPSANSGPSSCCNVVESTLFVAVSCRDRNRYSDSTVSSVCRIRKVYGFDEEQVDACFLALQPVSRVGAARHCDHQAVIQTSLSPHLPCQLKPTHSGHNDVEQQHVGLVCGGQCQTGNSVVGPPDIVSPNADQHGHGVGRGAIVVHDQHAQQFSAAGRQAFPRSGHRAT